MEIKTKRLVIREISHGEAKQISKLNDPRTVNEYLATLDAKQIAVIFKDKDAVADLLNRFRNKAKAPALLSFERRCFYNL